MIKTCKKCYWADVCERDGNQICDGFVYECECGDRAIVTKNGKIYCSSCALGLTNVEKALMVNYYLDGEHIGDEYDDIEDIIIKADDEFKIID